MLMIKQNLLVVENKKFQLWEQELHEQVQLAQEKVLMSVNTSLREIKFWKEKARGYEQILAQFEINVPQNMITNPNKRSSSDVKLSILSTNKDVFFDDEYFSNVLKQ